jgi:hypothetical protein
MHSSWRPEVPQALGYARARGGSRSPMNLDAPLGTKELPAGRDWVRLFPSVRALQGVSPSSSTSAVRPPRSRSRCCCHCRWPLRTKRQSSQPFRRCGRLRRKTQPSQLRQPQRRRRRARPRAIVIGKQDKRYHSWPAVTSSIWPGVSSRGSALATKQSFQCRRGCRSPSLPELSPFMTFSPAYGYEAVPARSGLMIGKTRAPRHSKSTITRHSRPRRRR